MSHIILVRHGETIWHAENRYAGSSDIALTPRGLQQADVLASWAANAELTHLYVSPMQRALDTARPTSQVTGLEMKVDARLREVDFGHAEGLTSSEQRVRFPAEYSAFLRDPAAHYMPGGEDPHTAVRRGREALDAVAATCGATSRVLVVAHNTLIRLLLCDLLGVPLSRYRELLPTLRNTALTEIRLGDGAASLLSFNVPLQ